MIRRLIRYAPPTFLFFLTLATSIAAQVDPATGEVRVADTALEPAIPVAPPTGVAVRDVPNDRGGHLTVSWEGSVSDENGAVDGYLILRSESPEGPFDTVGNVAGGTLRFDDGGAHGGTDYYYRVVAVPLSGGPGSPSDLAGPVRATAQWFHTGRIPLLIAVLLLGGSVLWFIERAKAGDQLYIRKIAGLEAVDEAVGRATEMGRKIFYVPGIQDMNNVQTIAGTTILGRVAQLTAEYEADLQVPTSKSMVMVTCREVVKEAHLNAGRPDSYREDNVYYLTDDQFGYAAAVDGMVVRDKPATIFYMGAFYAESLILAETGNSIGAIQIAGTAQPAQLPFFVAACDYTLIGEELFAASAYLSKEPRQLGSLKGQDVGKAIILVTLLVGVIWQTLHLGVGIEALGDFARFFVSE